MQWDASPHAGFTTGTPWIAVNPNHLSVNAAAARADPDSVFHYYRRLFALRRAEPALVHGDFAMLLPDDERVYAYLRRLGGTEILIVGNIGGDPVTAEVGKGWSMAEVLLANTGAPRFDGPRVQLGPWQAAVVRRRS
jgi:oligo-1,6-glucosidase